MKSQGCFSCVFAFVLKCIAIFRPRKDEVDMMLVFYHRGMMLTTTAEFFQLHILNMNGVI